MFERAVRMGDCADRVESSPCSSRGGCEPHELASEDRCPPVKTGAHNLDTGVGSETVQQLQNVPAGFLERQCLA